MIEGHRPSLEGMLQHLYASVLDAARFEDFAADLRLVMNAHLVAVQTDDPDHRHSVQKHFTEHRIDVPLPDFANDASINAFFVKGAYIFSTLGVIDGGTLFASGELERTAFYREHLIPVDVHHSMGICLAAEPYGHISALTVSRDRKRPAFEPETIEFAKRLLPHLHNVYQLQQRLQQLESTACVMDRVAYGIWLLDSQSHVVKANVAAEGLLGEGHSGLTQRGSLLFAAWRPDQLALQAAIASGITALAARRSDILLHDARGQPWATCTVHPLHRTTLDPLLPTTQAACILLVHPFSSTSAGTSTLREVFGLTPAEAELADALLRHGSLNSCAKSSGKAHETLRTQLKALFAKTETHRQAELIRRLETALD